MAQTRFLLFILFLPLIAWGYDSVVAKPQTAMVVLPLPTENVERFGVLTGFPHTYEFTVEGETPFAAQVYVPDTETQKNTASMIVVKQERKGVSEIGRTNVRDATWESSFDYVLAQSFRKGGEINTNLTSGTYTLEISSPDNDGMYRLVIGNPHRGYFENVRMLFEVRRALGLPFVGTVLSPLVYIPLFFFIVCALGYVIYRRTR